MKEYKTHTCNEISLEDVGKKVRIAGFVETGMRRLSKWIN